VWALLGRRCECARAVMCDGAEVVHGRGWRAVEGGGGAEGARWKAAAAQKVRGGRRRRQRVSAASGGAESARAQTTAVRRARERGGARMASGGGARTASGGGWRRCDVGGGEDEGSSKNTNAREWVMSRQERNMTCGPRSFSYRRLNRRLGFEHRLIASVQFTRNPAKSVSVRRLNR
jgi:hypothetical protein